MKSNEKFNHLVKKQKIKINTVSKATGIANSTLYEWHRGLYSIKFDKLQKIGKFLGVDATLLLDDDMTLEEFEKAIEKPIETENKQEELSLSDKIQKLNTLQNFVIEYIVDAMLKSNTD